MAAVGDDDGWQNVLLLCIMPPPRLVLAGFRVFSKSETCSGVKSIQFDRDGGSWGLRRERYFQR